MRCKAILVILATEWRTAWSSATMPMIAPLTPRFPKDPTQAINSSPKVAGMRSYDARR